MVSRYFGNNSREVSHSCLDGHQNASDCSRLRMLASQMFCTALFGLHNAVGILFFTLDQRVYQGLVNQPRTNTSAWPAACYRSFHAAHALLRGFRCDAYSWKQHLSRGGNVTNCTASRLYRLKTNFWCCHSQILPWPNTHAMVWYWRKDSFL